MDINSKVVNDFFNAFQQGDWKTMQQSYDDDAVFYDPVFENLNAVETRAMWHMLCSRAKDFSLKIIKIDCDKEPVIGKNGEEYFYCKTDWEAVYTFSATGRTVKNKVRSNMKIYKGLILEHMDDFNLYAWSRQAFGLKGVLLGLTSVFKSKLRNKAQDGLALFMRRHQKDYQ